MKKMLLFKKIVVAQNRRNKASSKTIMEMAKSIKSVALKVSEKISEIRKKSNK